MKPQIPIIDSNVGYVDATNIERPNYNLDMDMVEVYRTDILKQYPFQCYPGETYAPEQIALNSMALDGYKLRWYADKLYICEYLENGQTKDDSLVMRNPMGFAMMFNQNILIEQKFIKKFKNACYMLALISYAREWKYIWHSNNLMLTILALPVGILIGKRRKRQFRKLKEQYKE